MTEGWDDDNFDYEAEDDLDICDDDGWDDDWDD